MVDVTPGVGLFYEIVKAADEFEAFMAECNKAGGSIHIGVADEETAKELTRLIVTLQEKLKPYRDAARVVDAEDASRN